MGANPPHALAHAEVAHVFRACLADGYQVAVDMLTRADEDTDAAPEVSVSPEGTNPETGGRFLEEIAFEVLDTERMGHVTEKAEKPAARGVRRVFCVRLTNKTVYAWQPELPGWVPLDRDAAIVDRCFRVPIPAASLVDRMLADEAVARAARRTQPGHHRGPLAT